MKKRLSVLAALCVLGGSAMAQSSVTLGGFVDLGVGRNVGDPVKGFALQESAVGNSRIVIRGTEDLGGGMSAFFGLEHRFRPDTGSTLPIFWHGFSVVGLKTPYGTLKLGRDYTPSFWYLQTSEPFGGTTVAQLRETGNRPGASNQGLTGAPTGVAAPTKARVSDAIFYELNRGGFTFAASMGDREQEGGTATGPNRPWSAALAYADGPLFLGLGYENPQFLNDHQWNIASRYTIGNATLYAGVASGKTDSNLGAKGGLVGVSYRAGPGDIKFGYAQSKVGDGATAVERRKLGLGYWHNLSKRTTLYTDVGHEFKIAQRKTGVDLGLIARF